MEPPVSSANPITAMWLATAAAVPALDPPGTRSRWAGLIVGPAQLSFACVPVQLKIGTLVLPRIIASAARMRATTGLSRSGIRSTPPNFEFSLFQPAVVGNPFISIGSFTTIGTPARGPTGSPAAIRRSTSLAVSSAASSLWKIIALNVGFMALT